MKYYFYDTHVTGELYRVEAPTLELAYRHWAIKNVGKTSPDLIESEIESLKEDTVSFSEEDVTDVR